MRSLLFFWMVWVVWFVMGCQPLHHDRYLPSGWSVSPDTTQLLARSYPRFDWMTLILLPKSPPHHLFTAPLPPLFQRSPDDSDEETPSFLPRFPWQPTLSPTTRTLQGFRIDFRSNQPIHLACRLQFITSEKILRTVESRFFLPASPRHWIRKRFLWADFLPLLALSSQTTPPSDSSFFTSKPRLSGTSQPTSKPRPSGASQPLTKPHPSGTSQSTSKPHLPGNSQPISKLHAIEKREAFFSAIELRGGIAFWDISPRKRSVTLTLRGPFALSTKRKSSLR